MNQKTTYGLMRMNTQTKTLKRLLGICIIGLLTGCSSSDLDPMKQKKLAAQCKNDCDSKYKNNEQAIAGCYFESCCKFEPKNTESCSGAPPVKKKTCKNSSDKCTPFLCKNLCGENNCCNIKGAGDTYMCQNKANWKECK